VASDQTAPANITKTIQVVQLVPEFFQKKSPGEHRKLAVACHSCILPFMSWISQ